MEKFTIHIPAKTNKELRIALEEAGYILTGLSEAVNGFDKNFTGPSATKKAFWKRKADEWKLKYKVVYGSE